MKLLTLLAKTLNSSGSSLPTNKSHHIWPDHIRPQSHLRQTSPTGCCSSAFLKVQGARVNLGSRSLPTLKDNQLVNLLLVEIGRSFFFCFGDRWSVCLHKVLAHDLSCKVSFLNYLYLSLTRPTCPTGICVASSRLITMPYLRPSFPGRVTLFRRTTGVGGFHQHGESLRRIGRRHLTYRSLGSCIICHAIIPWELA